MQQANGTQLAQGEPHSAALPDLLMQAQRRKRLLHVVQQGRLASRGLNGRELDFGVGEAAKKGLAALMYGNASIDVGRESHSAYSVPSPNRRGPATRAAAGSGPRFLSTLQVSGRPPRLAARRPARSLPCGNRESRADNRKGSGGVEAPRLGGTSPEQGCSPGGNAQRSLFNSLWGPDGPQSHTSIRA